MRGMAVLVRPVDCFTLRFERGQCVIGMIFDYIVVDMGALRAALGTRFDKNDRHALFLQGSFVSEAGNYAQIKKVDVDFWHLADRRTVFRPLLLARRLPYDENTRPVHDLGDVKKVRPSPARRGLQIV
jgi:hypothetical protein